MTGTNSDGFVGRSHELELLHESLRAAHNGVAQLVVVEGEAGIGKTALLQQFVRSAAPLTTVWAGGDESELALDYGVANQLGSALPDWSPALNATDAFAVGTRLLAGIGATEQHSPVIVVIDDLHWADLASCRALLFCLRRLRNDDVLVLLATRPDALERLGESWRRLLTEGGSTRWIRLAGLTSAEVAELAAARGWHLTRNAGARLHDHTAGSPLYVSALLAELPPSALREDAAPLPAPHSYAATVISRLARLPKAAQQLVSAAAVLGTRSAVRAAFAVAGLTDRESTTAALDAAVGAELLDLVAASGVDELVFRHPLVRAAVYEDLGLSNRRRLHLAAAEVMPPPLALHHRVLAAAGALDDRLADELTAAAAVQQERGALPTAAAYLIAAARLVGDADRSARLLFQGVELLLLSGDVYGAHTHLAAIEATSDTPYRRYTLALLAAAIGKLTESAAAVRSIVGATTPEADKALFARCAAVLSYLSGVVGDDVTAIRWATQARQAAAGVPTVDTLARQALAWAHAKTGGIEKSLALLADCNPESERPAAFESELLAIRGTVRNWAGDYDGALTDLRAVVRWAQAGYPVTDISNVYASMAEAEFRLGDWYAAATHVELAISLGEDLDHGWYAPYAHSVAAQLCAVRGDFESAASHVRAADQAAATAVGAEANAYATLAKAHLAWVARDWQAVVAALAPWEERARERAMEHPNLAIWRYRLAEAHLAQGRLTDAQRLLADAPGVRGGENHLERLRLNALLHQRAGRLDAALAVLAGTVAGLAGQSSSLAAGLIALNHGRLLIESKQRRAATAPLLTARSVLTNLGAVPFVRECDSALTASGVALATDRGADHDRTVAGLTAREQVVARMVSTGMTNREVAADLYLSVKAVEYHLTNIFAKLHINSRKQLRFLETSPAYTGKAT